MNNPSFFAHNYLFPSTKAKKAHAGEKLSKNIPCQENLFQKGTMILPTKNNIVSTIGKNFLTTLISSCSILRPSNSHYPATNSFILSNTSSLDGIELHAPLRVVQRDAATLAIFIASFRESPSLKATQRTPQ